MAHTFNAPLGWHMCELVFHTSTSQLFKRYHIIIPKLLCPI